MCWKCANNLTQEQMEKQMDFILNIPITSFDKFNTTSLIIIIYCNFGLFGEICREKSFEIMDKFLLYIKTKKLWYMPDTGIEPMYHPDLIRKIYWYAKNYDFDYTKINDQEYIHNVLEYLSIKFVIIEKELEDTITYKINKFFSKPISKNNESLYYGIGFILGVSLGLIIVNKYLQ